MSSTTSCTRPRLADVILYSYLWRHQVFRGEKSGRKDHPCLVLATTETRAGLRVVTAPISTKHHDSEQVVTLPPRVAQHLGLELGCSVVCDDLNRLIWIGGDVRAQPGGTPSGSGNRHRPHRPNYRCWISGTVIATGR